MRPFQVPAASIVALRFSAILCLGTVAKAAPLLSESFDGGLGGWVSKSTVEPTAQNGWSDSSGYAVALASNLAPNFSKMLVSPKMDLSSTTNPALHIIHRESCSSSLVELNVYYSDDGGNYWSPLQSLGVSGTETMDIVNLSNSASNYRLGFELRNTASGPCQASIDEVTVGPAAEVKVTGVRFSGISHERVTLETVVQPVGSTHGTVSLTIPYGTSRSFLTPLFTGLVGDVTPSGYQDLSTMKSFTVQSYDKTTSKIYDLVVNWTAPSTAASLTHMKLCEGTSCSDSVKVDSGANATDTGTITAWFPEGSSVKKLTSTIFASTNATSATFPASGPFDLSEGGNGLVVTVTAQDGTTKRHYKVVPSFTPVDARVKAFWLCDPSKFGIPARSIWDPATSKDTGRIVVDLPSGLAATQYSVCQVDVSDDATRTLVGTLSTKGTGLFVRVTKGLATRTYAVTANVRKTAGTDATVFGLELLPFGMHAKKPGLVGVLKKAATATSNGQIEITMKPGSSLSSLTNYTWFFGLSDPFAYVNADDGNATNLWGNGTSRVYTITAENLVTALKYTVSIKYEDQSKSATLKDFAIWLGSDLNFGVVDTVARTVKVDLPLEANLKSLYCTFTAPQGATASIPTENYQDFSVPFKFSITSPDSSTTNEYTVTVNAAPTGVRASRPASSTLQANLADGILSVRHPAMGITKLSVFNVLGHCVASTDKIHGSQSTIDLRKQPDGIYFLRAQSLTERIAAQPFFKR
ncbi:MAG: hypothetical protein RL318_2729 [Fibrobacterota bacterium]|jgi:hypothetical protein